VIDSLEQIITNRTSDKKEAAQIIGASIRRIVEKCGCPVLVLDGMEMTVTDTHIIIPEEIVAKHREVLNRYWYNKWGFYRKSYFYKGFYRDDDLADVEIYMSRVRFGEEDRLQPVHLIQNLRTLSFETE
jgi:hypothetical protein